jgi:hypothetical protein
VRVEGLVDALRVARGVGGQVAGAAFAHEMAWTVR